MLNWLKTHLASWTAKGVTTSIAGVGILLVQLEGVFIIVAIVGVYLVMSGHRSLGTKFTSLSILLFLIAEVLSKC